MVLDPAWDVAEQIGRDEECIEDPATSIKPNESELIGQTNGERNVIL